MSNKKNTEKTVSEIYNDEITIGELIVKIRQLFSLLWREKLKIIGIMVLTLVLGLIIDYSTGREYEAYNSILTYTSTGAGAVPGNLSGLAGLAGINIGDNSGGMGSQLVSESMLPMLIATYPVGSKLAEEPIRFYFHEEMSTYDYFRNVYKDPPLSRMFRWFFGIPRQIFSFLNPSAIRVREEDQEENSSQDPDVNEENLSGSSDPINVATALHRKQFFVPKSGMNSVIIELTDRILIEAEDGVLMISARMPDPYAAYDLASLATEQLMQEMINFEVRKTRNQLMFIEEQYEVSRQRYEEAQVALADFMDRNLGNLTAMAQVERQRLQNDFELTSNIYGTWSRQVEETRMKLREDTPLFTVVDPVQVPSHPVKPNPVSTAIISLIIGFIWAAGYVTINRLYQAHKPAM